MEIHKPKFVKGFIEEILIIVIGISLAVISERIVEYFQHRKESKSVISRMITELKRDSSDRKSTRLNSSHSQQSRMPSSA